MWQAAQPVPAAAAIRGPSAASAMPLRANPSRSHSPAKWRAVAAEWSSTSPSPPASSAAAGSSGRATLR